MNFQQSTGRDERFLRRYEYDDSWVIAADLDVNDEDVDVDIVGQTAILVVENADRVTETEFELPGEDASVSMNNGVLTITIEK
jgi:HSP20 family molecular chaperone IbpA